MRILIISEYFPRNSTLQFSGGVEARNFYVAKYLSKRRQITVLTQRLIDSKEIEKIGNFDVIRVGRPAGYEATASGILKRLAFIINCIKSARTIDADIVEGTNFITHLTAYLIARGKKIPAIAWYPDVWVGSWIRNVGIVGIIGEVLERVNLKLSFKYYIAISLQTKKKLQKYTKGPINIIPCGVDPQEYKANAKKRNGKIICISRLAKYKNVKDLVLAFALIHKQLPGSSLTIIGEGPEKKNLLGLIANLKLGKEITFLSSLKRISLVAELKESKVFCLPSQVEGFGISIIESAAAGVPYIASNIPVIKEVTHNFLGGSKFEVGNVQQLAQKLKLLLTNEKLYGRKKSESLELASFYHWDKIARETEKVYTQAQS